MKQKLGAIIVVISALLGPSLAFGDGGEDCEGNPGEAWGCVAWSGSSMVYSNCVDGPYYESSTTADQECRDAISTAPPEDKTWCQCGEIGGGDGFLGRVIRAH